VTLHIQGLQTLVQVKAFVSNNEAIAFTLTDRIAAYGWMGDTLKQFHYGRCTRADKGVLRQYLGKVTGFSRAQVARCIKQFTDAGVIQDRRRAPTVPFVRRLQNGRHPVAGRDGCITWHCLGHHHAQTVRTGVQCVWRCPL